MRGFALAYGLICYVIFFLTFLYAIGFVGDFGVPRTIDSGTSASLVPALIIDAVLLGVFAVQHSLMARPAFKAWWTKIVPPPIERSTYVLFASLALMLIFWQWRALPQAVWAVQSPAIATVIRLAFWAGWAMVLLSTFLINHFDLFGLRQVWAYRRAQQIPPPEFRTPLFYKVVRHPLYLGFIIAFWAAPTMSQGHLFFALATTAYILIAIQLEEHDMVAVFGERYLVYRKQVSMLIPLPRPGRQSRPASPG
jgi:protein-S-isoprenylcysteine O-methyltransferase Ste14